MDVSQKIMKTLGNVVQNHVWAGSSPREENYSEWIAFENLENIPADNGDNRPIVWAEMVQIHWCHRGNVNYYEKRNMIRKKMLDAGFIIIGIAAGYNEEKKRTEVIFTCQIEEEGD